MNYLYSNSEYMLNTKHSMHIIISVGDLREKYISICEKVAVAVIRISEIVTSISQEVSHSYWRTFYTFLELDKIDNPLTAMHLLWIW